MPIWFLLTLALGQEPRPSAPANMSVRTAATATVSSGEDAYVTWTLDAATTGMTYDTSLDEGPWVPVVPADLIEVPRPAPDASKTRTVAVNLGQLTLGRHTAKVRECDATRATCMPSAMAAVTVIPPVPCEMWPWSPWAASTDWVRAGAVETRTRTRSRGIKTWPGPGAAPCPATTETIADTRPWVPPPLDPVTITYVRMDSTTKGAWTSTYGSQGQVFASAAASPLPFVTVTPVGASLWTWAVSTTDDRGLQHPGPTTASDRFAVGWYAATAFELDVRFSDTQVHQVALYAVDWDHLNRAQRIEILDSQDTVRHAVTTGSELGGGVYYVWLISGHAKVRITRTTGANGVAFALLFGPGTNTGR